MASRSSSAGCVLQKRRIEEHGRGAALVLSLALALASSGLGAISSVSTNVVNCCSLALRVILTVPLRLSTPHLSTQINPAFAVSNTSVSPDACVAAAVHAHACTRARARTLAQASASAMGAPPSAALSSLHLLQPFKMAHVSPVALGRAPDLLDFTLFTRVSRETRSVLCSAHAHKRKWPPSSVKPTSAKRTFVCT
eukprot:4076061-Pleurochrysis_carterae.AAC.1